MSKKEGFKGGKSTQKEMEKKDAFFVLGLGVYLSHMRHPERYTISRLLKKKKKGRI